MHIKKNAQGRGDGDGTGVARGQGASGTYIQYMMNITFFLGEH